MNWYIPSFHGDLRLEPDGEKKTVLSIVKPTEGEKQILVALSVAFGQRGWIEGKDKEAFAKKMSAIWQRRKITINAPIEEVGPVTVAIMKPGPAVLTAVRFKDGHIETCETHEAGAPQEPYREPPLPEKEVRPSEEITALAKKPDAAAAATVSRPTPCCPDCYAEAVEPATEVLLAFLDEEQHKTWAKDRFVVCRGGLSGHRYLLAHRHSAIATRNTRIAYDLDDDFVMHFHNWAVPPEEEVLASMLILEHREPWLRNEATCFAAGHAECVFKNPFGDISDGVADATFTRALGIFFSTMLGVELKEPKAVSSGIVMPVGPAIMMQNPVQEES